MQSQLVPVGPVVIDESFLCSIWFVNGPQTWVFVAFQAKSIWMIREVSVKKRPLEPTYHPGIFSSIMWNQSFMCNINRHGQISNGGKQ